MCWLDYPPDPTLATDRFSALLFASVVDRQPSFVRMRKRATYDDPTCVAAELERHIFWLHLLSLVPGSKELILGNLMRYQMHTHPLLHWDVNFGSMG